MDQQANSERFRTDEPTDHLPIRTRRLHEEVADRLEASITSGALGLHDSLPSERELMAHYGVGRPAVREALLSLQQRGLIERRNGERARVASPNAAGVVAQMTLPVRRMLADPQNVRHFQGARSLFETALAREAASMATAQQIATLANALCDNRAQMGDRAEFARTDVLFHLRLAEIPANPIFTALHQALGGWLTEQRRVTLTSRNAFDIAYAAHVRIFEAVAAHDPDAAATAMSGHLFEVSELYWKMDKKRNRR